MFDFDAGKMIVFGIVALAVIPPKDLPRVMRTVGKYVGQMRRMASDFQGQFMDAMKEAELDGVKQEIAEINKATQKATQFDVGLDANTIMRDHVETPLAAEPPPPATAIEPTRYETVTVDLPATGEPIAVEASHVEALHVEALHVEAPHEAQRAASNAT